MQIKKPMYKTVNSSHSSTIGISSDCLTYTRLKHCQNLALGSHDGNETFGQPSAILNCLPVR